MKKLTKKQREIIDNLKPRCEDCQHYRKWRGALMCHRLSPFLASKETQRLRPAGSTMNCGTEGREFMPNANSERAAIDATLQCDVRCSSCPECGGELVHTEINDELGDGYRVCRSCGQEWWADIDYPEHINKKPNPSFQGTPHREEKA